MKPVFSTRNHRIPLLFPAILLFLVPWLLFRSCTGKETGSRELPLLRVSENGHFLMTDQGDPFFWLGDTGWLLFSRLNREEAGQYLSARAEQGFNVIQVMVLHGLGAVNVYGDSALVGMDISIPDTTAGSSADNPEEYDYWDHVDYVTGLAAEKGIYMALVPVWGSSVRAGRVTREQAGRYATWLARRYARFPNVIFLNGGDTRGDDSTALWNIMGDRLHRYAPGHLVSFHPFGRTRSSTWFHREPWLDFNMFQSGHRRYDQDDTPLRYGEDNWRYVRDDYRRVPPKPTLDGEPSYEGIPQGLHDTTQPRWNDDDVRRYAYWSVFAGACGFTYGNNAVMQMHRPSDTHPAYGSEKYWYDALNDPGAREMIHLKDLMLSRPYFSRIPDPSLIAAGQGEKYDHLAATRGNTWAMIYTYRGNTFSVQLGILQGSRVKAGWFDPRTGEITALGTFSNSGVREFDPPGTPADGNDRVLILDAVK